MARAIQAYLDLLQTVERGREAAEHWPMVIVVPEGCEQDPTRDPTFYDGTYRYLRSMGVEELLRS